MRTELSTLFYLGSNKEHPVTQAHFGDGVYIEEISDDWLEDVKSQCPRVSARQMLERIPYYKHRIYIEYDETDTSDEAFEEAQQSILKAIILSRIVKPTPIPFSNVWVTSFHTGSGPTYDAEFIVNSYSVAFVKPGDEQNTITDADAQQISSLWTNFVYLHQPTIEPQFRRVMRAIKFYEFAHAIYWAGLRHLPFHAALESLIYCGPKENKAQVSKRLPLLLGWITENQAREIYELNGNFKHEAQAMLQTSLDMNNLSLDDQKRLDTLVLLEKCVQELLLKSITDLSFAEVLSNCIELRQKYGVQTGQGIM